MDFRMEFDGLEDNFRDYQGLFLRKRREGQFRNSKRGQRSENCDVTKGQFSVQLEGFEYVFGRYSSIILRIFFIYVKGGREIEKDID